MDILMLGGTGAMGKHLVQLLSSTKVRIVVTSRLYHRSIGNIQYKKGNAHEINFLREVLARPWDVIIDFMVYSTVEFSERISFLLNATSQYIFLSSARVYANSEPPITETSPRLLEVSTDKEFLSSDEYSLAKARQEDILVNSGRRNWTIIRPYITYSENRLQLGVLEKEAWLYRALQGRTIVFSEDIASKKTTLTYGFDVSKAIIAVIGKSSALGETYHITSEEILGWTEVLNIYSDTIEKCLGFRPKVSFRSAEEFAKIHPSKYQIVYDRVFDRVFDNMKISQFTDVKRFTEAKVGLESCLTFLLSSQRFKKIDWKAEALKDRLTGEHASILEIKGVKQKLRYIIYRYLKTNPFSKLQLI